MGSDIDMDHQDASSLKGVSPISPKDASRHPEIELGDLADSLCSRSDEDEEGTDVEEAEEEDYEASRLKRIRENQLLLSSLGIQTGYNAVASSSSLPTPATKAPIHKKRKIRTATYDRSGYIISLPNPGEKHVMACIELPSDRKLRKRIADVDYVDCSHWAEGEERRWRFGDGRNPYMKGEEVVVGGVGPDFRWRKWMGLHQELRNELVSRGQLNEEDARGTKSTVTLDPNVSEYSLIPGMSCHQCRRKSEKAKMRCRNTNPECNASFCSSCCKRYSYFEFDSDSRSFICPLCMNICNCSNCIRKRDLSHLLEVNGLRTESLTRKLKREGVKGTVETYLKEMGTVKETPFERVRLVCQEEDIISPELPPEPVIQVAKPKKIKTKKTKNAINGAGPGGLNGVKKKKKKKSPAKNGNKASKPVLLKFKVPRLSQPQSGTKRPKEVDSDGDTVGGYSDDDEEPQEGPRSPGSESSLSSAPSSLSATPPRRLAFPPRPAPSHLDSSATTTSLAQIMDPDPGYIRPEMMHQAFPRQSSVPKSSPKDDVIRVNKLKRPPPAASIVRAPSYMTNPSLARSTHQNATGSSSSSTSSSALSNEQPPQYWRAPALGLYQANGTAKPENGIISPPHATQSSSPDPLLLPISSFVGADGKQPEREIADDIFLHNPPSLRSSPLDHPERDQGEGEQTTDRDRGPLFPDTPLWYTYNHPNQQQ